MLRKAEIYPIIKLGLFDELQRDNPDLDDVTVFPTVQDRAEQLASEIPAMYPLKKTVQELCESLRATDGDCELPRSPNPTPRNMIDLLRQTVRPLKLHAEVLNAALRSGGCDVGCTELHQYIGDVLCVAYLLYDCDDSGSSNNNCSFAEGSPTPYRLAESIRRSPPSCYRSWVLMHASILRTQQFSDRERSLLGIHGLQSPPEADLEFHATMASFEAQIYSKSRSSGSGMPQSAGWTMPMDSYRTETFLQSEMVLVYDDFGPLGPSFRGRDVVRVRDLSAQSMLACFTSSNVAAAAAATVSTAAEAIAVTTDDAGRGDARRREALAWMCVAHEQAFQARPVSVRTPVVRFG